MARTMIQETNIAKHFWAEAVNTACYIQNRISIRPILNKTPYELWKNKKPNISYFHPFGCTCFVLNTKDHLRKFDSKAQKCMLLGYSERSKGYRIYNKVSQIVEESIHVRFDDNLLSLVSLTEPTSVDEALLDKDWVLAMKEELDQFTKNDVWDLVQKPKGTHVIGTKWVFRNKLNE